MTNKTKLKALFTNIDSKAYIFKNAFLHGMGYCALINYIEIQEVNMDYVENAFENWCYDYNVVDHVDGEYINYVKLFLNPDGEYVAEQSTAQ